MGGAKTLQQWLKNLFFILNCLNDSGTQNEHSHTFTIYCKQVLRRAQIIYMFSRSFRFIEHGCFPFEVYHPTIRAMPESIRVQVLSWPNENRKINLSSEKTPRWFRDMYCRVLYCPLIIRDYNQPIRTNHPIIASMTECMSRLRRFTSLLFRSLIRCSRVFRRKKAPGNIDSELMGGVVEGGYAGATNLFRERFHFPTAIARPARNICLSVLGASWSSW